MLYNIMSNILIFGCTGLVGKVLIDLIESRNFQFNNITLVASKKSKGKILKIKGMNIIIQEVEDTLNLNNLDFIFFCSSNDLASKYCNIYLKNNKNCYIIDNSSFYRLNPQVDIIIPPINKHLLDNNKRIISNSNCTTSGLVMVIYHLRDYGIKKINITSLQSVSGSGYSGINQLNAERNNLDSHDKCYDKNIYNNVIPLIGSCNDSQTTEELKLVNETRKILNNYDIEITTFCVRVPIEYGHSLVVNMELEKNIEVEDIKYILSDKEGLLVHNEYVTPNEIINDDNVHVSRLKKDKDFNYSMFITFNNLLRGASLNSIEIAESIINLSN